MMTGPWQTLRRFLVEAEKSYHGYGPGTGPTQRKPKSAAEYKADLLKLITRRFGEAEADEVTSDMRRLGSFQAFKDHMALKYMSDDIDGIVKDMGRAAQASAAKQQPTAKEPGAGSVKGPSGREYVPPDVAAQKRADVDAMRQARQSVGTGGAAATSTLMTPGRGGAHAMGTAGQNAPKVQPSVAQGIEPATSAADLKNMRVSRSGLVKAQRQVDRETKEKGERAGDQLAAQLGVPTTKQRTVTDKETGEPRVQVWGPDRVLKAMDPDLQDLPVAGPGQKTVSMGGAEPSGKSNEPMSRVDLIKRGIVARNKAPAAGEGGPSRPPSFDFEVWRPHGREMEVPTNRPDAATGNWIRGKRAVNPAKTGRVWVGYRGKWYTEDQIEKMFPGKELGGSKGLVNRATARAGTVPTQGTPASSPDDDE